MDQENSTHMAGPSNGTTVQILPVVSFTFIAYLSIGVPLAILPTYLHLSLGLGTTLAGFLVSLQYVGTFVFRPVAGYLSDTRGPRPAVIAGLILGASSGFLLLISTFCHSLWLLLGYLALSRLALGIAESLTSTGATMWAIGRVGTENTAQVISWNGIATYGALAVGAPLGAYLASRFGIGAVGIFIAAIGLMGWFGAIAVKGSAVTPHKDAGTSARQLLSVAPFGACLALSGMAFGVIASFTALFFAKNTWQGAPLALTFYGSAFVLARLLLSGLVNKVGGFRIALTSMAVEIMGILVLAYAQTPRQAYLGCVLSGLGFSLVFPALAVELIKRFPKAVHGSVLGVYSAFVDLTLFLTGPAAGFIILHAGYRDLYLFTAASAFLALLVTSFLQSQRSTPVASWAE